MSAPADVSSSSPVLLPGSNRFVSLAVLAAAIACALATRERNLGAALLLLAVVGAAIGPRIALSRMSQAFVLLGALVVGVFVPRWFLHQETVAGALSVQAITLTAPILLIAIVRATFKNPVGGGVVTLAAALVALTGAGRARFGLPYLGTCVAFFVFAVLAFGARTLSRPGRARRAFVIACLVVFSVQGIVAWLSATGIARLHARITSAIERRFRERTGFRPSMSLDSLNGLFQSDTIVLRVKQGTPSHLQGVLLTRYVSGNWSEPPDNDAEQPSFPTVPRPGQRVDVEIEFTRRPESYFIPPSHRIVGLTTATGNVTQLGILRPIRPDWAKRVFTVADEAPAPPPFDEDLQYPKKLARFLRDTIHEWGVDRLDDRRSRANAIEARLLADYRYSFEFDRTDGVDPIADFLTTHKSGHCEYFASAMVLLLRAGGVPARLAAGYRVSERSPFGDYAIVRERDAHAWVEAWIDDRWETFDPTPPGALGESVTPLGSAAVDYLGTQWERADDFLAERSAFELSLVLVVLVGAFVGVRALRARDGAAGKERALFVDAPAPELVRLLRALARHDLERRTSETLHELAERIRRRAAQAPGASTLGDASAAIEAYAANRFGDVGDAATVRAELTRVAERVRRAPAATSSAS